MREPIELKPCPFCGKIPRIDYYIRRNSDGVDDKTFSVRWLIECPKCEIPYIEKVSLYTINPYTEELKIGLNCFSKPCDGLTECINKWNNRCGE